MAQNNTKLSELMTIRDILMGEIIEEYNSRFEALTAAFEAHQAEASDREAALHQRIQELEQSSSDAHEQLKAMVSKQSQLDRHALGAQLLSLGQHLQSDK